MKTVSLEGLDYKVQIKYLKYFEKKVNQKRQGINESTANIKSSNNTFITSQQ